MGKPIMEHVPLFCRHDLRNTRKSPKCGCVENAVAVTLGGGAVIGDFIGVVTIGTFGHSRGVQATLAFGSNLRSARKCSADRSSENSIWPRARTCQMSSRASASGRPDSFNSPKTDSKGYSPRWFSRTLMSNLGSSALFVAMLCIRRSGQIRGCRNFHADCKPNDVHPCKLPFDVLRESPARITLIRPP